MFNNKPFEQFCRDHFVNDNGEVQSMSKSKSALAEKKRVRLQIMDVLSELRPLQAKLNSLSNRDDDAAQRETVSIRKRVKELKRHLKKLRGRDGNRSEKTRRRADQASK